MSTDTVSETVSKKRGRPRVLSPTVERLLQQTFPEVRTRRGLQNKSCEMHALCVILDHQQSYPELMWLYDKARERRREARCLKTTILQALGRIEAPELLIEAARFVCEWKPKSARAGVRMVNCYRFADEQGLIQEMLRCRDS